MNKNKPEDIEIPEQDEGQDERILSTQGVPFKTEQRAKSVIERKGLDPNQFRVQAFEDGFAIVRIPKPVKQEKYYKVRFNERQNEFEDEDVTLSVNGEILQCQRGVETIIPGRFKECCEHAIKEVFTQMPNEPRKSVGHVMTFPFSLIGETTEEEYLALKAEGNKKAREAAEKRKLLEK